MTDIFPQFAQQLVNCLTLGAINAKNARPTSNVMHTPG